MAEDELPSYQAGAEGRAHTTGHVEADGCQAEEAVGGNRAELCQDNRASEKKTNVR